jgi:uncharacterized protein YcaQ
VRASADRHASRSRHAPALRRAAVGRRRRPCDEACDSTIGARESRASIGIGEDPTKSSAEVDETVRLLAPFERVVWDRRRFELFWGWRYRIRTFLRLR